MLAGAWGLAYVLQPTWWEQWFLSWEAAIITTRSRREAHSRGSLEWSWLLFGRGRLTSQDRAVETITTEVEAMSVLRQLQRRASGTISNIHIYLCIATISLCYNFFFIWSKPAGSWTELPWKPKRTKIPWVTQLWSHGGCARSNKSKSWKDL